MDERHFAFRKATSEFYKNAVGMVADAFWVNTNYDCMHYFSGLAAGLLLILGSSCM